jgi:hypothetical protein
MAQRQIGERANRDRHDTHLRPAAWRFLSFLVPVLLAINLALVHESSQADESAPSAATSLLMIMRVDDQLIAQMQAVARIRCERYPEEQREPCNTLTAELLRDMEGNRFAQLMAPFIDRNFTAEEIAELAKFFASSEGKKFTELVVAVDYYRLAGELPKNVQPIDKATQARLDSFFTAGVGKKYIDLMPEYNRERDKHAQWYLCAVLGEERHMRVRSILPVPCST